MQRTQIYLTAEEDERISAIASDRGTSKSAVIRHILDQALSIGVVDTASEDREVLESTAGICADYPDWPEWLEAVRGRNADERLRFLGL